MGERGKDRKKEKEGERECVWEMRAEKLTLDR